MVSPPSGQFVRDFEEARPGATSPPSPRRTETKATTWSFQNTREPCCPQFEVCIGQIHSIYRSDRMARRDAVRRYCAPGRVASREIPFLSGLAKLNYRSITRRNLHGNHALLDFHFSSGPNVHGIVKLGRLPDGHGHAGIVARGVRHPQVRSARTGVQAGLYPGVVCLKARLDAGEFQQFAEKCARFSRVVKIVAAARKGSDEQGAARSAPVLNCGDMTIRIMAHRPASRGFILLKKIAAVDAMAVYLEQYVVEQIRREFHVTFARAEQLIEPVVRLSFTGAAVIAEVRRETLADQRPAALHVIA